MPSTNMKPQVSNTSSCRVLVFNPYKRLVAIHHSQTSVARALGISVTNVHFACVGKTISCKNLYFRQLKDEIEITLDDLGTLRLEEYDELCGEKRKYYPTKEMTRVGMKYNKKNKNKNED